MYLILFIFYIKVHLSLQVDDDSWRRSNPIASDQGILHLLEGKVQKDIHFGKKWYPAFKVVSNVTLKLLNLQYLPFEEALPNAFGENMSHWYNFDQNILNYFHLCITLFPTGHIKIDLIYYGLPCVANELVLTLFYTALMG